MVTISLWILRAVFLLMAAGVGVSMANTPGVPYPLVSFFAVLAGALALITADVLIPRKRFDVLSSVYFGMVVGLILTYFVVGIALEPMFQGPNGSDREIVQLILGVSLCYICISLLMQTKDDFRFIIPYVEFSREVKGLKPYVLDTSVAIDGRIADLVETGVLDNELIMPRFVLAELQAIADSSDKLRRSRGRRGLDILNRLRSNNNVDLKIYESELPEMNGQPVDMKLVLLAKHLEGKVVTGDYNLNKVAKLHNVQVINLNDIANSLKPSFLPGEMIQVKVVKPGEEDRQGVGYLDDGTMIVIEGGRDHISQNVTVAVTSVLQTSAGRMIFGRYEGPGIKG